MANLSQISAIIFAGITVGVADGLIKKVALTGSFLGALKNPLMIAILLLYVAQIAFFIYVFQERWSLGIAVNIQIVFYSLTVVLCGLFFFGEKISLIQSIGIGLAMIGVALMNF